MKKIFSLLFISGILAVVSCGGSENKNESAAKDSAAAAASASKADSMLKMSSETSATMPADSTKN